MSGAWPQTVKKGGFVWCSGGLHKSPVFKVAHKAQCVADQTCLFTADVQMGLDSNTVSGKSQWESSQMHV